jgi:hypothetical protein
MRLEEGIKHKGCPYFIPDCSRDDLPAFFKGLGFKVGAEIGVSMGENILKYLKEGFKMYGIDPYLSYPDHKYRPLNYWKHRGYKVDTMEDVYDWAMKNTAPYGDQFTMIKKTSVEAANDIPGASLDFVYIDGNHLYGYVAMDLMLWAGKVRQGGVICGHDYYHPHGSRSCRGIAPAVDGFVRSAEIENFWVLGAKRVLGKYEKPKGERLDEHLSFMMFRDWK